MDFDYYFYLMFFGMLWNRHDIVWLMLTTISERVKKAV